MGASSLIPLEKPEPDFDKLLKVLKKEEEPDKVHFVELGVDYEVMRYIFDNLMTPGMRELPSTKGRRLADWEKRLSEHVNFYYRMGYDYAPVGLPIPEMPRKFRKARDTAVLSRGERIWVEEGIGIIASWDDLERYPWDRAERANIEKFFGFVSEILPEGMKITITSTLYEFIGENLLGRAGLFKLLYSEPDLVKAVFDRWGRIVYDLYRRALSFECVGAIFHADDLGYKTGLDVRPEVLRELVMPWYRKYSELAHGHGRQFWFHSCGNVYAVMEDLIEDVRIDAFHSFQDVIMPVWEFKERYGRRIATLGGVDMDKLARYDEGRLRSYVRFILERCMPGGGYALGSGNTIANYVPVKNYLIMLEEGLRWRRS